MLMGMSMAMSTGMDTDTVRPSGGHRHARPAMTAVGRMQGRATADEDLDGILGFHSTLRPDDLITFAHFSVS